MMSFNVGDSALLFIIKSTFFFLFIFPAHLVKGLTNTRLAAGQGCDCPHRAQPGSEGHSPFCQFNAGFCDGHPCKSPCPPQQLTAQS